MTSEILSPTWTREKLISVEPEHIWKKLEPNPSSLPMSHLLRVKD